MEDKKEMIYDFFAVLMDFITSIDIEIYVLPFSPRIIVVSELAEKLIKHYVNLCMPYDYKGTFRNLPVITSETLFGLEFRIY